MSKSETTAKPNTCDICGKEIPIGFPYFICEDYKIRCVGCYQRWAGVDAS